MVPIVPLETQCERFCCRKRFLPLQLAYAKTIHTFQGANAGPTETGQPSNAVQIVSCDPGTKKFENCNAGMFYTLMSWATTMGTADNRLTSAIYFDGPNMNPGQVQNLTRNDTGQLSKKANRREMWVETLNMGKHDSRMDKNQSNKALDYGKNTVDLEALLFKFSL